MGPIDIPFSCCPAVCDPGRLLDNKRKGRCACSQLSSYVCCPRSVDSRPVCPYKPGDTPAVKSVSGLQDLQMCDPKRCSSIPGERPMAKSCVHGGSVVSTVASQQKVLALNPVTLPVCVEFACSLRDSVGFLRALRFLPTFQKHAAWVNWKK